MGSWGVGIFSNDLGADTRDAFRDLIAEGRTAEEATASLTEDYGIGAGGAEDNDFWLALAAVQHKTGHVTSRVIEHAGEIIQSDTELDRWTGSDRPRRKAALDKLAAALAQEPPAPKRIRRRSKVDTALEVGQHVLFTPAGMPQGLLLRVTEISQDKGGRYPGVVALEWDGSATGLSHAHRLDPLVEPRNVRVEESSMGFLLIGEESDPEDLILLPVETDTNTPVRQYQSRWMTKWSEVPGFFEPDGRPSSS